MNKRPFRSVILSIAKNLNTSVLSIQIFHLAWDDTMF